MTSSVTTRRRRSGPAWQRDLGLLVMRLVLATSFIGHGAQKVFGAFGGTGIDGFARGTLAHDGFRFPEVLAWVTGVTELVGGVLVAVGLLTPLAAAGLLAIMLNTVLLKFHNGFFFQLPGGFEIDLALAGLAAGVLLVGPGRFSIDAGGMLGRGLGRVLGERWVFLLFGIVSGLVCFVVLRT